jgi:MFS transporter, DHA1 family, tetracycline resistance protein
MRPLYFIVCLNIAGLGAVIPLLPFYATHFGAGADTAPLVFSIFSGAGLLTAPLWGRLSDYIGRKPVMLACIATTILSYLWLATAHSLWEVFASRALAGAAAGWLATAQAYVADSTSEADRAKGMGLLGASIGLGFVVGPTMGGLAVGGDTPNYALPSILAGAFSVTGFLATAFFLKEPTRHEPQLREVAAWRILANGLIARLFLIYLFVFLAFTALEGTFPLWCEAVFALGPRDVAWYMTFIGVVMVIVQGGLVGRLSRRYGESWLMVAGIALIALGLGGLPFAGGVWLALAPLGAISVGFGLQNPAMQSLISRAAPDDLQGGALGATQSVASFARILGPAWGGAVFVSLGPDWPYLIGALVLAPMLLIALPLARRFDSA